MSPGGSLVPTALGSGSAQARSRDSGSEKRSPAQQPPAPHITRSCDEMNVWWCDHVHFVTSFIIPLKWGLACNLNNLHKSILFRLQPPLLVMISSQPQPQPLALSPLHFGRLPPMMMAIALLSYIYSHTNTATASKISTNRCFFSIPYMYDPLLTQSYWFGWGDLNI